MIPTRHIICTLCLLLLAPAQGADRAATTRLAETWKQASDLAGEVVELQANGETFVALLHPHTKAEAVGAVVLLHDPWTSADSDEVIHPLRVGLARHGWETLSLQLPAAYAHEAVAQWQAADEPIRSRLSAALAWLENREHSQQVVLALGASASPALRTLADTDPEGVVALVMVSAPDDFAATREREAIAALARPVLDVLADRDRPTVLRSAAERRLVVRDVADLAYHQYRLAGARAGFPSTHAQLLARVRAWLKIHAAGT